MKILVDADACPVKETVISLASEFNIPIILVKSFAHFSHAEEPDDVETVYVDSESEAADYKIMQLAMKEDLIITQDYGLASLGLAKGCYVMHHKGFEYTKENIDQLLDSRYISAMERKSGLRTKGPKPFKDSDRDHFKGQLLKVLEELLSNNKKRI